MECEITCGDREVYSDDRLSCNECQPYTRSDNERTVCKADQCGINDIILFNGQCSQCPEGQ